MSAGDLHGATLTQRLLGEHVLFRQAVTHPSYVHENPGNATGDNERLEYLGDAVVGLAVASLLYEALPEAPEGELTRLRARLVRQSSLARVARKIGLDQVLLLGRGEELTGGRAKESVLGSTFEAWCGAYYLVHGFDAALAYIKDNVAPLLHEALEATEPFDAKGKLQALVQAGNAGFPGTVLEYRVAREDGPPHQKRFWVDVLLDGTVLGSGEGRSKKEAEEKAAQAALSRIQELSLPGPASHPET